jgi:hypothetical protein
MRMTRFPRLFRPIPRESQVLLSPFSETCFDSTRFGFTVMQPNHGQPAKVTYCWGCWRKLVRNEGSCGRFSRVGVQKSLSIGGVKFCAVEGRRNETFSKVHWRSPGNFKGGAPEPDRRLFAKHASMITSAIYSIVAKIQNVVIISNITFCENTPNCLGLSYQILHANLRIERKVGKA